MFHISIQIPKEHVCSANKKDYFSFVFFFHTFPYRSSSIFYFYLFFLSSCVSTRYFFTLTCCQLFNIKGYDEMSNKIFCFYSFIFFVVFFILLLLFFCASKMCWYVMNNKNGSPFFLIL